MVTFCCQIQPFRFSQPLLIRLIANGDTSLFTVGHSFCLKMSRSLLMLGWASFLLANLVGASISKEDGANDVKIVMPQEFGNFSLTSCSGAPACGTAMAS